MSRLLWVFFACLAIMIGIYPVAYLLFDMNGGLLSYKDETLIQGIWMTAFYLHILPGGIALLVGWSQFSPRLRNKRLSLHRSLGKIYLLAVAISGVAGLYVSFEATGGIVAKLGFASLAIAWLFTSFMAWKTILRGAVEAHKQWMIRSFALCFAAVTLRIWLPAFTIAGIPFLTAYIIIAWLCWVPNLIFAELLIRKQKRKTSLAY